MQSEGIDLHFLDFSAAYNLPWKRLWRAENWLSASGLRAGNILTPSCPVRGVWEKGPENLGLGWSQPRESAGWQHIAIIASSFWKMNVETYFLTLQVAAYFKGHQSKQRKRLWIFISQKVTSVYKAAVYIFTWWKEKNDSSKPLGMEIWVAPPPALPSLFVLSPFNTSSSEGWEQPVHPLHV